jgi:hypothetical protein
MLLVLTCIFAPKYANVNQPLEVYRVRTFSYLFDILVHRQTLAYRTSLGPSLQLQKWLHAYHALTARCSNTT